MLQLNYGTKFYPHICAQSYRSKARMLGSHMTYRNEKLPAFVKCTAHNSARDIKLAIIYFFMLTIYHMKREMQCETNVTTRIGVTHGDEPTENRSADSPRFLRSFSA